MAFITAETRSDLIELSVAMLKQAPSAALLDELIALSVGGGSLADAADHIAKTDAFKAEYPSFQTAEQYAAEIFDNITTGGTVTADIRTAVIELATGMLTSGSVTKAGLALAIAEYLAAPAALLNTDFADIAQSFQNRADAAEYFVVTKELGGSTDAELAAAIASVTSDAATLTAANTAADATASAEAVVAGQTFTLTTGLDTGSAFTGGAGNDTFVGVNNDTSTIGTMTSGDSLVGGAGTDTLAVVATGTATPVLVSTSGIEVISLTNNSGADITYDASLMTDLSTLKVTAGTKATTISSSNALLDVEAVNTNKAITVTSAAQALGAADSAAIKLTGVGTTTSTTITNDGVETLNVTLSGAASGSAINSTYVTVASTELETVNVTGDVYAQLIADLTGADLVDQVATFDASGTTAGILASVTAGGSSKMAITGGSGNDVISIGGAGAMDKDYTIEGGEGVDTLIATASAPGATLAAADYVGVGVTGFEVISGSVDFRSFANNDFVATTGAGTYAKAPATVANSYLTGDHTMSLTRATDTSADALNVHVTKATAATVSVTIANEETVTINSAGLGSNIDHTFSLLSAADLTDLTVIGTNGLVVSSLTNEENLESIDASAHTGKQLNINATDSNQDMTVTGSAGAPTSEGVTVNTLATGSGDDTVTGGDYKDEITTNSGNDSITAGAGNDSIVSGSGDDVIDLGAGNDTVQAGSGDDNITGGAGNDVIDAGTGNDTVDGGAGNDLIKVSLSDTTSVDGGAGTDRVADTTGTITTTTSAGIAAATILVDESAAPTLTGIESMWVLVDAETGTSSSPIELDLTNAPDLTALYVDTDDNSTPAGHMSIKNFAGSSLTLFGGTASVSGNYEADNITLDGTGQSATINLQNFVGTAAGVITVKGVDDLTIAADSTSQLTGNADQANRLGVVVANTANTISLSTSGSAAKANGAMIYASVSATAAESVTLTVGELDDLEISASLTTGADVETVNITVGDDAQLQVTTKLDFTTSAIDTVNINMGAGSIGSDADNATPTYAAGEYIEIDATSVADFDIDLAASSTLGLNLAGVVLTDADATLSTSSVLQLGTSLGAAGAASNLKVSGRGSLDFDDGSTSITDGLAVTLAGSSFVFDASGLTVDTGAKNITGTAGDDTIKTGLGADSLDGGAGNDIIQGGGGDDVLTGGAGTDAITGGAGSDTVVYSDITAATSHSLANLSGVAVNLSTTAITAATVATAMGGTVVIGGGAAVAGADLGAGSAGYLATSAANSTATMVRDSLTTVESVIGSALNDYIALGAEAATVTGGNGADVIVLGTGAASISFAGTTPAAQISEAGDSITGFTSGTDVIVFELDAFQDMAGGTPDTGATTQIITDTATNADISANATAFIFQLSSDVATTEGTNKTAALTIINALTLDTQDGDVIFAIDDGVDSYLWLYEADSASTKNDETAYADEITFMGTVYGVSAFAVGDIIDG